MSDSLDSLKSDMVIRPSELKDIPAIRKIAIEGFGQDVAFTEKNYEKQIQTFPEGQRVIEYEGKIIGASGSFILNAEHFNQPHEFSEVCDDGNISNHDPSGKHLYGIEVVVDKAYRHLKAGKQLYKERKRLCQALHLKSIVIGGRIPLYHTYAGQISPDTYIKKVMNGELYDPVITFQLNNGFKFVRLIDNYIPEDKESCGYAAFMEWDNPEYQNR